MKLTNAQKQLLAEVANGEDRCSDAYNPARRLVDIGLCVWATDTRLALTEAGRSALSQRGTDE